MRKMNGEKKRLLLVDGSALLHRAYHAMPGLTDRQGRPTGAVYGLVRMLLRAMKDLQPTHVAVAFDRKEPTFRKEMFIGYQAHRPEMDEELGDQFDRAKEILEAMEVPVYEKAGFEADDVIGTIAARSVDGNQEVVILTGDKDLMQLVNEKVKLYLPVKGVTEAQLIGSEEVKEKLGVRPDQVVDYKGLVGDPSDNYPGVKGIGPKTAVGLLSRFGSFEKVYDQVDEVDSDAIKKKLKEGKEAGELSRDLAKIRKDVEVEFDLDECAAVVKQPGRLARVLEEYGFQSLVKQLGLEEQAGGEQMKLV